MTDDLGWVALGVKPDASGFSSSLSRQVGSGIDSEGRRIGSRFSAGFKKAAVLGGIGVASALTAGVKLAVSSLGEAEDSLKVARQTAAVLKSTGGVARVSEKDVGRLANQLSRMSGIDDELIQSGENVLLTFKDVRNEAGKGNDIFDQGTKVALDMSAALGTDLQGSVIQVGKALNDPVKGITALQRVGVSFTESQKATIKRLAETGDTLGAQKLVLRELTSEFKGSARSQATEGDKLNVAFGNLKETIGKELLPYMDDLKRFIRKEGIPAVHDFFGFMHDTGAPAIKRVAGFMGDAAGTAKDLIGFLKDLPDPAKYAGLVALVGGVGAAKLRGGKGGLLGSTGSVLGLTKPVNVFVTNPGFGAGGGAGGFAGGAGGKGIGALPGYAPFIPIGVGGKIESTPLPLPPEFKKNLADYNRSWDDFGIHAKGAFQAVEVAIDHATPILKRYQRVLDGTPRQIKTWVGLSGYEKAIGQIKTLSDAINALPTRGLDNGVPYLHGGMSVGTMNVNANDWNDIVQKGQKRAQQANLGGRP